MSNIYLLRHGKVNGPAALYGNTDIDVSPATNNDMLNQLIENQHLFSQILTSPLIRCAGIAHNFATRVNKPIDVITNLQEMNFGDFDGLAFDDIAYTALIPPTNAASHSAINADDENQSWTHLTRFWQNPALYSLPNAEKLEDFYLRVKSAWQLLLTKHHNENILLVTHGGVIRMILAQVLGLDWKNEKLYNQLQIANATISQLSHTICDNPEDAVKVHTIGLPLSYLTPAAKALRRELP
jgi:alpha-ribazole phosphatase